MGDKLGGEMVDGYKEEGGGLKGKEDMEGMGEGKGGLGELRF